MTADVSQLVTGPSPPALARELPDADDSRAVIAGLELDVAELSHARSELEAGRRRLAAAELLAGVGSFEIERASGPVMLSSGMRVLLNLEAGEDPISFTRLMELIRPDSRERLRECLAMSVDVDVVVAAADGEDRVLAIRTENIADADGTLIRRRCSASDVTDARALQQRLERSDRRARQTLRLMPDALLVCDAHGRIEQINDRTQELFGYRPEQLIGETIEILVPDARRAAHVEQRRDYVAQPKPQPMTDREVLARRRDGTTFPVAIELGRIELDGDTAVLASARDVSAQRAAERALRESEERFRLAFDDAPIGMAMVGLRDGARGRMLRVNEAMARIVGFPVSELIGKSLGMLDHPDHEHETESGLAALGSGEIDFWEREKRYRHARGHAVWVHVTASLARTPDGRPAYAISQIQDISPRKEAEARLTHLALHDSLTGLPNRALLTDHIDMALSRARRSRSELTVLFLDLDDFKLVNDSMGHEAGDELLIEVAARLRRCVRDTDTVARLGGDEFVVVCEELSDGDEIEEMIGRIESYLAAPLTLRGHDLTLRASVGVATSHPDSTHQALLRDADAGMYHAKQSGKGRSGIADDQARARASRQLSIEAGLSAAIENGRELCLEYQPCVELATDRIVGAEALLRWDHPLEGRLMPDSFLDVAETRDLIVPIGAWVIRTACEQAREWWERYGEQSPTVWVNVSCRQLGTHQLTAVVANALADSGLPAHKLGVELTERQIIQADCVLDDLYGLRELGVGLAIDDFGTGYNGFDYLRDLPVDHLKIDRSFVNGLGRERTDTALTVGITTIARSLDLGVIAEGVETEEQRSLLRELGCEQAQGYLLGRPAHPEVLTARLREQLRSAGTGSAPFTSRSHPVRKSS